MTLWIILVLVLYVVQTLLPPTAQWVAGPDGFQWQAALGGRDNPPTMSVVGARLQRAQRNMEESLFVFLPLAILLDLKQPPSELATTAAAIFFVARLLYVPAYASGIPGLRSVIWCIGFAANLCMAKALLVF